jgi:hypothetical protein
MSKENWHLEIYRQQGTNEALISAHDFHNLVSLRIAITENRGSRFVVREPDQATPKDRITLLDMRAQGFNIQIASSG